MGIFHSKVAPAGIKQQPLNNQLDPRSPTVNINRSPIGSEIPHDKPAITKVRDLTSDLTVILDSAQTPERGSGAIIGEKLQFLLDPRSPGTFDRTPLVLDESGASNVSICGSSLEFEEISGFDEDDPAERSLSFKDCEEVVVADAVDTKLFSDMSLNSELRSDIETIIQNLYDDDADKDPRSPSINIQRTPIVFVESPDTEMNREEEQPQPEQQNTEAPKNEPLSEKVVIHRDAENNDKEITTPLKEKTGLLKSAQNSASRTPLGCVTNLKTPGNVVSETKNMRKTALFGQMKQNSGIVASVEAVVPNNRKSLTRSKIPTLRMK